DVPEIGGRRDRAADPPARPRARPAEPTARPRGPTRFGTRHLSDLQPRWELAEERFVPGRPAVLGARGPGDDHGLPAQVPKVANETGGSLRAGAADRREVVREERDAPHG